MGRVTCGERDIAGFREESWLSHVSIVFQDVLLFDDTVAGNIRIGREDATDDEVRAAAETACCTEFRSGRSDSSEFWFEVRDKFLYVRYFAVRDEEGNYLGALETTQDIGPIRALKGENRRGSDN